ncbi:hypothetical protein NEMIN01_1610 [Nematocida minor]|uniref:uncharacterized protein n=1 Tax=Nematocida minor TaxID=1912983 RepID=UPI00221F5F1F|nr:uncharacterized protein NEMIN01_1610 [Nematocida minor]KAI5191626.1 hypothetical protein NEMIN01_1610 [Nematocida minor]
MSEILNEVLGTLKLSNTCSLSVGEFSIQLVSKTTKLTAITVCDCSATGSAVPRVYSTEILMAAISDSCSIEEVEGSLKFTHDTDKYTLVNTIQPLLLDFFTYEIPDEWNTKVIVETEVFKRFVNLQADIETSIYLSNGILYFCAENSSSTDVVQISALDILLEGTDKVTVYFSSLRYLNNLLGLCEKVSIMYTKEYFSVVLMFKDDVAHHRVIFNGIA